MNPAGDLELLARVTASLVAVVLLALLAARLARRTAGRGHGRGLRVLDRVALTRESSLAVVEVAGRGLVLGIGPQGVRMLTELDAETVTRAYPEPPPDPPRPHGPSGHRRGGPDEVSAVEVGPDGVRVTRMPDGAGRRTRSSGSVLDPRTWRQAVETLRDYTARRG